MFPVVLNYPSTKEVGLLRWISWGLAKISFNTKKHTTPGIRWSSPTQLLIQRFAA
ncbi:hypothetical protein FOXYSP1_03781 [Fusarium oxysporum f. sp. phaseoli]